MAEYIIGRDAGSSQLKVTVNSVVNGALAGSRICMLGTPGSVPNSVSREHIKLMPDGNNGFIILNMNPNNVTFVNGVQVLRKEVTVNDTVELGGDKYRLNMSQILAVGGVKTYSTGHLERVWNEYHDAKLKMQIKERKFNTLRSSYGLIMVAAVLCSLIPDLSDIRIALYVFAAVFLLLVSYISWKHSTDTPLLNDKMDKEFKHKYVCPNPDCNSFLGMQDYEQLEKRGTCPYCHCKYSK